MSLRPRITLIGPGLLVAATGVGAGDLATAGFAGGQLGLAVLWAVVLGAAVKLVLTEGLARWQLATGQSILEGAIRRLGPAVTVVFALYLLPWCYFTGAALVGACGVTAHSMAPIVGDAAAGKIAWGAVHSLAGLGLVWLGGFRWFERIMGVCIAIMFVTVVVTAVLLGPDWAAVGRGLAWPTIPQPRDGGVAWTIALMGGVGGTLTVLCYGYWIREKGRAGTRHLRGCRIDLATGYAMTAVFGIAMVIIASGLPPGETRGAGLIVDLATRLEGPLGPGGRWLFLVGAWAAVFSSLLGVWQAVPLIFGDFWRIAWRRGDGEVDPSSPPCRLFLVALAIVPLVQVGLPFKQVQLYYAVYGAAFIPLLALALLLLNAPRRWLGEHRNGLFTNVALVISLALALLASGFQIWQRLS